MGVKVTRRSGAEIIATHFCNDIADVRDGVYQNYRPAVYVVGNDYYCSPPVGQKPPSNAPGKPWKQIGEHYGRAVFESEAQ